MKLSEHFTLEEMLDSQTATRKGMTEQYEPSELVVGNLKKLCLAVLEPLRKEIGLSINISSGYRCERVNKAIGGVANSQHLKGQAADIKVSGMNNFEIIQAIKKLDLPVDQVIEEFGRWVHVSYNFGNNRSEFFQAIKQGNKTIYGKLKL